MASRRSQKGAATRASVVRVWPVFHSWVRRLPLQPARVFFVLQPVGRHMRDQRLIPGSELRGKLKGGAQSAERVGVRMAE